MSLFSSLYLISFGLYLTLVLYILIKKPRPLIKRLSAAFVACLCLWSFVNIYIHNPHTTKATATLMSKAGSLGWIGFSGFFLWFILVFCEKREWLKKKWLYPLIFAVPLALISMHWAGQLVEELHLTPFGWRFNWGTSPGVYIFFVYYLGFVMFALSLVYKLIKTTEDQVKRKQARVIFWITLVTLVAGSVTDVMLPLMDVSYPSLAPLFGLLFASGIAYAMARHKFLAIMPDTEVSNEVSNIKTTMFDCLILLSAWGEIVSWNDSTSRLLGYKEEEVKGKPIGFLLAENINAAEFTDELIFSPNIKNRQLKLKAKSGKHILVTFSTSLLQDEDGNVEEIICIARDLTELKRNELIKDVLYNISEATRRTITLRDLLDIIRREVDKLMDARNFYVALVHDRQEAVYTFPYIVDIHPEELEEPDNLVPLKNSYTDYVLRTEEPLLADRRKYRELASREEVRLIGTRPAAWLGVPLRTKEDKVIGVVVVQSYDDETAFSEGDLDVLSIVSNEIAGAILHKQAEEKRMELEDRLSRSEKMEAIGRLAGGVAHDLNNVLTAIVSYPDLLLRKLPKDSPLRKSILTMQKSGQKAAAIVQDLLTLARRGVTVKKSIDLNSIISEYLESPEFEKLAKYHPGVHITANSPPVSLDILGSAVHLSKTLMNLVSNAAEAMPGGGELGISASKEKIERPIKGYYQTIEAGDYVVLSVSDTGVGIGPQDLDKIFEPFYTKKEMGRSGTGLGMSVVWGTIEDHRGFIDVQSTEGEGTTFSLHFPATGQPSRPTDEVEVPVEAFKGSGEHILVVDDDQDQREIASVILEELGYSVFALESGEAAVEYIKSNKVDLMLLDMIMDPGMDGLDTYRAVLKFQPGARAIIVSGFSESERVKDALALGAGAYLKKPYTMHKLGKLLARELQAGIS